MFQSHLLLLIIFAVCVGVTLVVFTVWFLIIQGPSPYPT